MENNYILMKNIYLQKQIPLFFFFRKYYIHTTYTYTQGDVMEATKAGSNAMEAKIQRQKFLIKMIQDNKKDSPEKVLALFCINTGLTMKKAREYYNELRLAGFLDE